MKKQILIVIILNIILYGCGPSGLERVQNKSINAYIITIDSCEYLTNDCNMENTSAVLAHKGNCKYCEERRLRIKEVPSK